MSINLSARQLAQSGIIDEIERAISQAGADPDSLAVEITETVLMEDSEAPVATLEALKRLGSRLVLDDFGTGYSSLSYLRRLPLDDLKLDRPFVAPLGPTGEARGTPMPAPDMTDLLAATAAGADAHSVEGNRDQTAAPGPDQTGGAFP